MGKRCMGLQVSVFSVDWNKVPWPDEVEHQLQFFLAGMPVYMDQGYLVVQDMSTLA